MRRSVIILALIAAFAATACGGGDDAADATADTDAAEEVVADVAEAADAPADTVAGIDSGACTEAAEALAAVPTAIGAAATGQGDLSEAQAQAQALADLADQVPEEFQADFGIIADTYTEIAATLGEVTLEPGAVPDAETQAALAELSTSLSDGAFITASTNITPYFAGGCQ